jgi:hypothetical protein
MALTILQRDICRLIAANRVAIGESYVAGGTALNEILGASRLSRDIDIFHDTTSAVDRAFTDDGALLTGAGFGLEVLRQRDGFVEALVRREDQAVVVQWSADSAFRFFPLVEHPEMGLTLHAFDLATNKVLALVGRVEPRDWIDVLSCDRSLQPFGYLAWAASGKDPGFSPLTIVEEASRTARYSAGELAALDFAGKPPDPAELSRQWHAVLASARTVIAALPPEHAGFCVLDAAGALFRGDGEALRTALDAGALRFHAGSIKGAFPRFVPAPAPNPANVTPG